MSQKDYDALRQELVGSSESSRELYARQNELTAKRAAHEAHLREAEAAGQLVPALFEDDVYLALQDEAKTIFALLSEKIEKPRLDATAMAALRQNLTPEEKARLRQELLQNLQSAPPEIKSQTNEDINDVLQKFKAAHGSTPEVEAALEKAKRIQEQINETP